MMESYLYSPYELAVIIHFHGMTAEEYIALLKNIFRSDHLFLQAQYRKSEKRLILAVMEQLTELNDNDSYLTEQALIDQDMEALGLPDHVMEHDQTVTHMIFKELRIRVLYINQRHYARMKLRTLLAKLGYKRRSPNVLNYIFNCLLFYHIVALRDHIPCDIAAIGIDEMITFRAI